MVRALSLYFSTKTGILGCDMLDVNRGMFFYNIFMFIVGNAGYSYFFWQQKTRQKRFIFLNYETHRGASLRL
jgi:hypothetical protein